MFCTNASLTIKINNQYFVCPQEGGITNITNYNGYIYCPEYRLICAGTVFCNNMFDCVDKKSLENTTDLGYKVNENDYGSVIEGESENSELESGGYEFVKGYELSNDENSKCPKNCFQCIEERRCFECDPNYYYQGTTQNATNPIKCVYPEPTEDYHYNISEYPIFGNIKRLVYFDCIEGCKRCKDGTTCEMYKPSHKLNSEKKCEDRIPHCDTYDPDSLIEDSKDNNHGPAYTKCKKCD